MTLCAQTRARRIEPVCPPPDFGRRFGPEDPLDESDGVRVWAFPFDPLLPGLPDAAHGPTIRERLQITRPASVAVTPLRYRPGQRAALRYSIMGLGGRREVRYAKVVGDDAFLRIFDAYRSYRRTGIRMVRPEQTGLPGVAAFPPITGTCLRELIEEGGALPSPERLVTLLERLAGVRWLGAPDPGDPARSIRSSGRLLAHLLPHRASEIRAAYRELARLVSEPIPAGLTVHGDLYEGQIFVDGDFSIGLIDLEDGGPGDPLLDAGNMLAHLAVLHRYTPGAGGRPLAYRRLLRRALLDRLGCSEADLDWREAFCALHLATGPFRVQSPNWPEETASAVDAVLRLLSRAPAPASVVA